MGVEEEKKKKSEVSGGKNTRGLEERDIAEKLTERG